MKTYELREAIIMFQKDYDYADIAKNFGYTVHHVKYALGSSHNPFVLTRMRDNAEKKMNNPALSKPLRMKAHGEYKTRCAQLAYLRANHRSQPTSD